MAKISIQELANMVGWKTGNISTYTARKKLVRGADGAYDTDNELNSAFIAKEVALKKIREAEKPKESIALKLDNVVPDNIGAVSAEKGTGFDNSNSVIAQLVSSNAKKARGKNKNPVVDRLRDAVDDEDDYPEEGIGNSGKFGVLGTDMLGITQAMKVYEDAKARKTVQQAQYEAIRVQKLKGIVVPTMLVMPLFTQHNVHILHESKNADEEILQEMAHKYAMSPEDVAEMRKRMIDRRNEAMRRAIESSEQGIDNLIMSFQEERGRGEKR